MLVDTPGAESLLPVSLHVTQYHSKVVSSLGALDEV